MSAYAFSHAGFHISITPTLVFIFLAALAVVWAIYTLIIRYHWKQYGTSRFQTFVMNFFYLAGSGILLGGAAIAAALYYASSFS